eukprot:2910688-Amphidinium_carterae.1
MTRTECKAGIKFMRGLLTFIKLETRPSSLRGKGLEIGVHKLADFRRTPRWRNGQPHVLSSRLAPLYIAERGSLSEAISLQVTCNLSTMHSAAPAARPKHAQGLKRTCIERQKTTSQPPNNHGMIH